MSVRVRFAPSPTGFLHIGSVRTALYNWLYAKNVKGTYLLRVEDTDTERSEEKFTEDFLDSFKWFGLVWDEEPLYQSDRFEFYKRKAGELIEAGHAYRCTCSEAEVEKIFKIVDANTGLEATADVEKQTLTLHTAPATSFHFDIDAAVKERLIGGLDDIGITLKAEAAISAFEKTHETYLAK